MDDASLTFVARLDDQASAAARGLRGTMDNLGGPVDPMTAALSMEAVGVDRAVGDVEAGGARAAGELDAAGAEGGQAFSDSAVDELGGLGGPLATAAAVAGAAAGAAMVGSLVGAMNVEQGVDKLEAQLGIMPAEAERLGGIAGDVYAAAWGESMDDVNAAVEGVYSSIEGMATASDADIEALTTKALALADAFEYDVGRSAQVAGQLVTTGLASDATTAFDLLTAASQRVPANVREDLLDAADEYGPFFASLGMSGEEAFSALVAGSEQGMYGIDKTGDALKELTIRATDMSASSVAAYEAAGLNAEDMAARFLAGGDVAGGALDELVAGLLAIEDPTARANAAIGLFGTPLEDLGVEKIPAFLSGLTGASGEMDGFAGSADRMTNALGSNAASNIEAFKRQVTTTAVEVIGGQLLPNLSKGAAFLATNFGPAVKAVTGWLSENKGVVLGVVGVMGALMAVTAAHSAVLAVQAAGGIMGFIKGLQLVQNVTKVATAVQWAWNAALTANPIGIIIAAVAALVAGLVWFFTQTEAGKAIWETVWGAIQSALDAVVSWWNDTVVPAFKAGFDFLAGLLSWYIGLWVGVWNGIVAAVKWAVDFVVAIFTTYVNIWRAIITGAVNGIRAVFDWFGSLPGLFRGWFEAAAGAIGGAVGRVVGAVRQIVDNVTSTLTGVVDDAKRIAGNIIDGLVGGLRNALGRVKDAAKSVADSITSPVKSLLGIHSPSRVGAWIGRMFGVGTANGLEDELGRVERESERMAAAMVNPLDSAAKWAANVAPAPVTVGGATTASTVVTIRHEVTSPDGSVREYTAQQLATILAADPRAAATVEGAVRTATQARQTRTLAASNGGITA